MRIDEIGATRVWVKGDDAAFLFHPECCAGILAAWDSNERRYVGRDIYDDVLTIKIADIVAVNLSTPEGVAMANAEADEQKRRAALE